MKLSKKVRWILVLPAMVATFFAAVAIQGSSPRFDNGWFAAVALTIVFLTGILIAPINLFGRLLHGKRLFVVIASLFILTCLFPPWRATNGDRHPMGYALIFNPPQQAWNSGFTRGTYFAQIDFGRLFVEWAALAAAVGMGWMLAVKRNSSQKFPQPSSSSKN